MKRFVMRGKTFDIRRHSPLGWFMSEKLDGVRAHWDGTFLRTKTNHMIHAPSWFIASLPRIDLDGELWIGRGKLQEMVSTMRKLTPVDTEWARVKYMVFDSPSLEGCFRQHLVTVPSHLLGLRRVQWVHQELCKGVDHFKEFRQNILDMDGEGVMLRDPESFYERSDVDCLLKDKPNYTDEAVVIGYLPGTNSNEGKVGSLVLRWNNKTFSAGGLKKKDRDNPPRLGAVVTFRYKGVTRDGIPRHPSFVIERNYE